MCAGENSIMSVSLPNRQVFNRPAPLSPERLRAALKLCLITDRGLASPREIETVVREAVLGGATMVQLREKTADTRDFLAQAVLLKTLLTPLSIPLLINDRVDIALACGADGVHLGQSDMPMDLARALLGEEAIIGLSTNTVSTVQAADAARATYLGVGPIYAQTTKHDAKAPLGVVGFQALRALTAKPLMAIGGLTPKNAGAVVAAGADGLAVVSAFMQADDAGVVAQKFCALF